MKSANSVKMLEVLALVLLVFSVTEGRIMNKCELKAKLDAAQLQQITIMEETITVNSLIARLVCKASTPAFNTSFVKKITVQNNETSPAEAPPQVASQVTPQTLSSGFPAKVLSSGSPPKNLSSGAPSKVSTSRAPPKVSTSRAPPKVSTSRGPPKVSTSRAPPKVSTSQAPPKVSTSRAPPKVSTSQAPSKHPSSQLPPQASAGTPPKRYKRAPAKKPEGSSHETQQPHLSTATKVVGHLYGVFQLSDQVACDSGMMSSLNICNITCSALADDDITDDIACMKTLTKFMRVKPKDVLFDVKKIAEMMLVKECQSVVPSKYFADCV